MSDTFDHECEAYDSFEREMKELKDEVDRLTKERDAFKKKLRELDDYIESCLV